VTPAGPLRAPLAAQAPFADAAVIVDAGEGVRAPIPDLGLPVFAARLVPSSRVPLAGREVVAFAGIGRPEKFFAGLEALGAVLVARQAFGDHARIGERAAIRLLGEAGDRLLVTTEKDAVRLAAGGPAARELARRATVVTVRAVLDEALVAFVAARIRRC
jgi:tetraacyldisaccharide 4'-kinase